MKARICMNVQFVVKSLTKKDFINFVMLHSMARANLNKSKVFLKNATAASKNITKNPESASIEIPPFRPKFT